MRQLRRLDGIRVEGNLGKNRPKKKWMDVIGKTRGAD